MGKILGLKATLKKAMPAARRRRGHDTMELVLMQLQGRFGMGMD